MPQLSSILGKVQGDIGGGGLPLSVQGAFDTARAGVNQDFATAGKGEQAYIGQSAAQSGNLFSTGQISDAKTLAAQGLDKSRRGALQQLDFSEAAAGLDQYNQLINLLGGGAGAALNLSSGFSGAQSQAIGGLSNQSPGWGALGGAASGAAIGSQIYPGWGTAIGAVLGGVGGYVSSNP